MGGRGSSSGATARQAGHLEYGRDTADGVAKALGVSHSVAERYVEAVETFTGDGEECDMIRWAQMNSGEDPDYDKLGNALESFISKAPKWNGGPTYRGLSGISPDLMRAMTTPGAVIDANHGTASWTSSKSVAQEVANYGRYGKLIIVHEGSRQNGTSVRSISPFHDQNEVMCSKKNRYRVLRAEKVGDVTYSYVQGV